MRRFIDIVSSILCEDPALRDRDPASLEWLRAAYERPDVDQLYLHGTNNTFDAFADPDTSIGRLIFASKLIEPFERQGSDRALQAEYYGRNLLLVKIHFQKRFNPNPKADPVASAIFAEAVAGQWDAENKVRYGRFDYQDAHLVVPPAVAAGYDFFRIYEMSMQGSSHGAAHASMIEVVDRYPAQ